MDSVEKKKVHKHVKDQWLQCAGIQVKVWPGQPSEMLGPLIQLWA